MLNRFRHLKQDERGISFVIVGMGFMAFFAVTALAVDVGMFMTARSQAQNAADAGALGGAVALVFNDYNDRSSTGPAVQSAVNVAQANQVVGAPVSITPSDVTFPSDPSGLPNRVQVQVYRTANRGNGVSTLIASLFGVTSADVSATATGEAPLANGATCVAPFTIPDKWNEKQTPPWSPTVTFNAFPTNPSQLPDVYRDANQASYTGYNSMTDRGLRLTIAMFTATNITPSTYFAVDLPGSSGSASYQYNIDNCNADRLHFGDTLTADGAVSASDTKNAIDALIAQDPSAYWDTSANKVVSSMSPSPRVKVVPVFNPYLWNVGKQAGNFTTLKASNYIGFFIEGTSGNNVIGRITPVEGVLDPSAGAAPTGAFVRVVRLVQ